MRSKKCVSCNKSITRDEKGISMKLLGEDIQNYYCLECLADFLEVTISDLMDKIEEFKEEGCTLFN